MVSTAQLIAFIIFGIVMFFLGAIIAAVIHTRCKSDGRLVIDDSDYFVAITTKTQDLEKKKNIILKVIVK